MFKTLIFLSSLGNISKARYIGASFNSGIDYDFLSPINYLCIKAIAVMATQLESRRNLDQFNGSIA
jgi:hypothetical protein